MIMKYSRSRKIAMMLAVITLFSLGFTVLSACAEEGTVYKSGTVLSVQGEARVHRGDGSLPAYKGLSLRHGDVLYTEADSTAVIVLDGDKYVLIEPDSSVTMQLYKNEAENVAIAVLNRGSAYVEADTPVSEGVTFGIVTAGGNILGGGAAYRAEIVGGAEKSTLFQAILGNATVSLAGAEEDKRSLFPKHECVISHPTEEAEATFSVLDTLTDPYSLPDRYIALDADGVFDGDGNIIARPPSGDFSLKSIVVKTADGSTIPLIPEFDNGIPGYVVESDAPATLTVTANHRRTTVQILCHTAASVKTEKNTGKVIFSSDERFHAVSILVIAEDGSETRFNVNIVPAQKD